ncbi:MAG: cytochrome b N-terminal domain-containing protein [Gemmatimonadetes bacterium]|nr:cytochrome b N-terminal domain-containing protein [Gemmatimonadota bacterium]
MTGSTVDSAGPVPGERPGALFDRRAGGGWRERLAWHALEYGIAPVANRFPYMLGGLTFFGILALLVTGVLLDQFYNPAAVGAHDSIVFIISRVPGGNWLRSLHYWSTSVVLVSVFLHLIYVFWRRSYFRPREVTWWTGAAQLLVLFALAFTGTVLRADQEGGEALAHAVAGARMVGGLAKPLTPEFTASAPLLARLHNAHVSLLSLLLLALVGLHFWLIRHLGIHAHEPRTHPFTSHLRRLGGYGLIGFGMLAAIAALFPPGIGFPAVEGAEVTKPFWPFLWIYAAENALGLEGMLIAPAILFGFLFAVPLLDRRHDDRGGRPRWLFGLATLLLAMYLGALLYGAFAPQHPHLGM